MPSPADYGHHGDHPGELGRLLLEDPLCIRLGGGLPWCSVREELVFGVRKSREAAEKKVLVFIFPCFFTLLFVCISEAKVAALFAAFDVPFFCLS